MRIHQRNHIVIRHQVSQLDPQVIDLDAPVLVVCFVQPVLVTLRRSQELLQRRLVIVARRDELGKRVYWRVGLSFQVIIELELAASLISARTAP
jgi:hypothetical protein